jgi:MATE family multidrug resistance protein
MTLSTSTVAPAQTTRGGVREVFHLAYPVVITQLSWLWTLFTLCYGTASGVQTFVSQEDGAGHSARCARWVAIGLATVVPATVVLAAIVAPAVEPALVWLGPSDAMRATTIDYVLPRLPGEVTLAALMVLSSFFRGVGDTRTPLYVGLASNAVNAVLDYGLIFGAFGLPAWGVVGAGVATSVGSAFGALLLWMAFRRRSVQERYALESAPLDRASILRFLRTSMPIGGQWFLDMVAFALFTTIVARMGDTQMAASHAFLMLLELSFMQAVGFSIAASTLVGRYAGAHDPVAAQRSWRAALSLCAVISVITAIAFLTIPGPLLRIFSDDPEVLTLGAPLLAIGALFQFFDATAIVTSGALRGAGDTRWQFVVQTLLGWGLLLPLAWGIAVVMEGGLMGAWFGALGHIAVLALCLVWRFRSGAWQTIRI